MIRIPHIRPSASTPLASMSAQHVAAMESDQAFQAALGLERRRISGSPFDVASLAALRRQTVQNAMYSANEMTASQAAVPYAYLDVPRVLSSNVPLSRSPEPMISEMAQDGFHNMGIASGQNFHDRIGGASNNEAPTFVRRDSTQHRPFVPRVRRSRLSITRTGGSTSTIRGPQPYSTASVPSGSALSDDEAHVVILPAFENEEIDQEIRESLSARGIIALPPRRRRRMEEPSTAQSSTESLSPIPGVQESRPSQQASSSSTEATQTGTDTDTGIDIDDPMSDNECSTPPPIIPPPPLPSTSVTTTTTTQPPSAVQPLPPCHELIENTSRLDIGGVTFDPAGMCMYVATVDGISEWTIKGSTTRWWSKGGWL